MSQLNRRSSEDTEYLERLVRSLEDRLSESKGETKGAVMVASQISQRASDLDAQLLEKQRFMNHVSRDARLMRRTLAELVVDLGEDGEGRDPVATLKLVHELLTGQGIILTADIEAVRESRSWRGAVRGNAPDASVSPVLAEIHETEAGHAHASAVESASSAAAATVSAGV